MSNVMPFKRPAKKKAGRIMPKSYIPITHPIAVPPNRNGEDLGMLEIFEDHVIVRAYTGPLVWKKVRGEETLLREGKKYIVDTPLEGARLLMRVHGLHHALVSAASGGAIYIHLPPLTAGEM